VNAEWAVAKMDIAEFRDMIDTSLEAISGIKSLFGGVAAPAVKAPKTEYNAPKKVKTADDKIADFLKTMGW
jgi:hypothetical protein